MPRYADVVMEHFSNPRNVGRLDEPDAVGTSGSPGRPPFMVMDFRLRDGRVEEVRYQTFGCVPAIAAGSMADGDGRRTQRRGVPCAMRQGRGRSARGSAAGAGLLRRPGDLGDAQRAGEAGD